MKFNARNAEQMLNTNYDIEQVAEDSFVFKPKCTYLEIPFEGKIRLLQVAINTYDILSAMEYFISIIVNNKWEIIKDERNY